MTQEQAQKVLDELKEVRPEVLNDEAKRLFEAIMKIANERDEIIKKQKEQIEYLRRSCDRKEECLIEEQQENAELKNKLKEKDKIIDLMAVHLIGATMLDNDEPIIFLKEEKMKQYFERQAKNDTKCT